MTMTVNATDTPRAWVGCLGCYNEGKLIGKWLDDPDEIREYVCPQPKTIYNLHEELWVMDHECAPWLTGECSPSEFADKAEAWIEATGNIDADVLAAYIDNMGANYVDWDTLEADVNEAYAGEYEDLADFAYRLAEDTGDLPEGSYANYIDWEAVGRDLRLGGDVWIHEVGYKSTHVFWNR